MSFRFSSACLFALAGAASALAAAPVTFVLDASYSMENKIEGERNKTRFQALKEILATEIPTLPADRPVGLSAFGVDRGCSEANTPLLLAPEARNHDAVIALARDMHIGSSTPFTLSMQKNVQLATGVLVPIRNRAIGSTEYVRPVQGRAYPEPTDDAPTLVFITDGRDSCGADPCQFVKDLAERGVNVRIRFIGVGVEGFRSARENLACMQQFPNFVGGHGTTKAELLGLTKKILDGQHDEELRAQALAMPYQPVKIETEAKGVLLTPVKNAEAAPATEPIEELRATEAPPLTPYDRTK